MKAPSKPTSSTTSSVAAKSSSVSPGKPDDDVRRERQIGDRGAELPDESEVPLSRIGAPHPLQQARGARLQRQVGVLAHGRTLRHGGDHVGAEVLRVRAREANPLDAVDRVDGAQQLCEARLGVRREVATVGVDVLAEQRDLANTLPCHRRHLGEDVCGRAAHLASADARDDAVRAHRVAAHRHLNPGLDGTLALRREVGRKAALGFDAERRSADADSARAEPVAQMADRPGAERDVHERVALEELLSLRLGVAAADGDDRPGATAFQGRSVAEVRGESLVGLLADRARVEDEHVGLVLARSLAEADVFEQPPDALGVVSVHLASERGDEVAAHRSSLRSSVLGTNRHTIGTKRFHTRHGLLVTIESGGGLGCPDRSVRARHGLAGELDGSRLANHRHLDLAGVVEMLLDFTCDLV